MGDYKYYNLTSPQKNIWNTEQYYKNTAINNICGSILIEESVDLSILAQAINKFIETNDSFKLRIKIINGIPNQYFIENKIYDFEIFNFNNIDEIKNQAQAMVNTPFEILESQLFDFRLFKLPNGFGGFIINAHHIISDAATFGMIGKEVMSNYSKLKNCEELVSKSFSYSDYIKSEQEYFSSPRFEKDKIYWNELFSDLPEVVSIPFSKNENNSIVANRIEFMFNIDLLNRINEFCKINNISLYNFLIAIYSIYIGKINNINSLSLGTPVLNRTNYEEKHTSGMFISTSLLKINVEKNITINEFIHNIAKNSLAMLKHQKYNYQHIIENLRENNPDITSLYDIVLSYQVTKANDSSLTIPYVTTWYKTPFISNSMNIHFHDNNDTGALLIEYDYQICKYDEQDIIKMHNRILWIINQVINNVNINIDDIEIVTLEEKNMILHEFNNTDAPYLIDKTMVNLFEEQVEKNPDQVAIVFENKKLTYGELNEKANSLANYLVNKEISDKDNVCICLKRSLELIISIYAVIKSGATYILLDSEFPKERKDYIINDSNSKYCIVDDFTNNLVNIQNTINISNFDFSKYNTKEVLLKNINDNLCIVYTSGSTGNPKGVLLHKHGFVNLVLAFDKQMQISEYKNVLGLASVSFDMFASDLFIATLLGNTFVLANEEEQKNPIEISRLIKQNNIEFLVTTPSRIELLLHEKCGNPLKNVKAFILGGENFSNSLYNRLKNVTNAKIYNGYGPTEISACCTIKQIQANDKITIGKPISNVQVYICNSNMNILPIGTTGEICVAGFGVSNGYLNNANSKSFIKNPFGSGYMYKTGDLGRFTPNGEIEYIGRSDNQIKIRGLRIELEEIENKINNLSYINSCVVIQKENPQHHTVLCTYFTSDISIDSATIRKDLENVMPKYMIPNYFVQMESLPHTVNGKVDKRSLPELEYKNIKSEIVLPRNEIDAKLVKLFQDLLNLETISINDNFFELGGDSLSAINLTVQIQDELNVQVFVKDILEHPTVQELSDIISENSNVSDVITIKPVPKAEYYEASSAQKRIFFASQLAGNESVLYNGAGGVIFNGLIDANKLEDCFKKLIYRHEALRTYFELENDTVIQKVLDNVDYKLDRISNCDFQQIDSIFRDFVKPFDLSKAPLFRTKYLSFTNGKSVLFFDMHHIISDGTSMTIFVDELCKLYNDQILPELNITYKDFSVFENSILNSKDLKDAENYWIHQFEDEIPVLNMPTSNPRPVFQSFEGEKVYSYINEDLTKKIYNMANQLKITPYMLLLSCYYILLSKYSSQEDIVIGSPIVNRNLAETYSLIGVFVNTLALRNKVDSSCSFKKFVLDVKTNLLDAYKYQSYPFDNLVNKLNIKRETSRNPLFDVMFTYQNSGFKDISFKDIKSEYYIPDTNISKFDLSLEIIPTQNNMKFSFEYASKLFNKEFIKNLSNHYLNILEAILNNIDIKISDIDMLSKEEKQKILYEFNDTSTKYPKDKTIVGLFEEQVEKNPDNTAIVYNDQKLTYRQLNNKANCLANYLINIGIKKQSVIPVIMNRSTDLIISMLAIIKIGAVYLPISMETPIERIDYILQNSNSKFAISKKYFDVDADVKFINIEEIDYSKYSTTNLNTSLDPLDLLYIIYTSGSTGKPKGVKVCNQNLVNFIYSFINLYKDISPNDRLLASTNISFDVSIFELYMPLLNGATLYLYDEPTINDIHKYCESIIQNQITFAYIPPNILEMIYDVLSTYENINLNKLLLGVEPIKSETIRKYYKLNANLKIVNAYGPTETTICATAILLNQNILDNYTIIPIGKPLDNLKIYILDKDMQSVPIGMAGEMYISGDNVSRGYLNNSELTEKAFVNIPNLNCQCAYKTGDLAKWDDTGIINFIGRNDNQVKINGHRIELGEIENIAQKYSYIKKAIAIKQSLNNREFITLYYTTAKKIATKDLRNFLLYFLPKYMVPSYYIALDAFPCTPNGKIDRKALPMPTEIENINKEQYVAPKTELQRQLVRIWEKILNTSPIGINDNFFELGGDSLLAMSLNLELTKLTQNISYQDIFRFPTIAEIEDKIIFNDSEPFFNKIENLSDSYLNILKNSTKNKKIHKYHPNNILITGATGFLGIHILDEFIKNEKGNVYCIIRGTKGVSSKTRLHQKLNYYFGDKYDDLIDKRIFAITGNITEPSFGLNSEETLKLAESIDLVIHSAANVSHYGNYNDFYNTNVTSVKYIIDFCNNFNKKIYHISTLSVADTKLDLSYLAFRKKITIEFNESSLYIGQQLNNLYGRTKFEAENCILEATSKGLDGYILRMGHLMPRLNDGVFQENITENDLVSKVIAFMKLGIFPDYLLNDSIDFTPVDQAAKAIYKLVTHPNNYNRIFHLHNENFVKINKIIKIINKQNYDIKILPENEFKNKINEILNNEDKKILLKDLINDFDKNLHLNYKSDIVIKSKFTTRYLRKTHFKWPGISNKYLINFINLIKGEI